MAKRDDKHSIAEDYLGQLHWQSHRPRYRGRTPWPWWVSTEPNWKYKPVFGKDSTGSPFIGLLIVCGFLAGFGYLLNRSIFFVDGLAIYMLVVFLFIGLILFLAARDSIKPDTDD